MNEIIFSCCIPVKDRNDPKLADLIASIKSQDFPQDKIEIIVVDADECNDPEQAKAIGIRRAKGEICAMFCADNMLTTTKEFLAVYEWFTYIPYLTGMFQRIYFVNDEDNSLNRYFSLIGGNDPVSYYLRKNDKQAWFEVPKDVAIDILEYDKSIPSLGDNGFYYRRENLLKSDLDHYYPMDCAEDLRRLGYKRYLRGGLSGVWHRTTDGNLIDFLIRRYKYARDLYSDRHDRRWKMLATREDYLRLAWFIGATILIIPSVCVSIRGFLKIRDWAWAWHWPVSIGFLVTYTILAFRNLFKYGNFFQKCQKSA